MPRRFFATRPRSWRISIRSPIGGSPTWSDGLIRRLKVAHPPITTSTWIWSIPRCYGTRWPRPIAGPTLRRSGVAPNTVGLLPFAIIEQVQRLRIDFRLWRIAPDSTVRAWIEQRIIDDAGILGHYVADGSNPHHTTKHHNGWVGENPKGYTTDNRFHGRFESAFVQAHLKAPDVTSYMTHAPQLFPDVRTAVIAYLNTSFGELDRLYALDKATAFQPETATPEQKAFAAARLAAGAEMLRDLWYTAWVTSAVP